jgi:nucleoside phosphorylase
MTTQTLSYAEDMRLHYDPEHPDPRLTADAVRPAGGSASGLPHPVPWPSALAPTPRPLSPAPAEGDSLARFAGYDAVVMTYTSAEAAALAALFTAGHPVSSWYEYQYDVEAYLTLVTGSESPFRDNDSRNQRYYHSLGLYFPCTVGSKKVLLIKSGLHLDYDGLGPDGVVPVYKMVTEMLTTVKPKMFITTGTGGGIGADVKLGDVIIAQHTRFDCVQQFKSQSWAKDSYATTGVSAAALGLITPALTDVNAAVIAKAKPIAGRSTPKIWSSGSTIVTTDFFAFDTSNNYDKLQDLGQVCDMGDAMVGRAMASFTSINWYAIRNASDPQVPMTGTSQTAYKNADHEAGNIYRDYGGYTTAASVIAAWAIISS